MTEPSEIAEQRLRRVQTTSVFILAVIATGAAMRELRGVLVPFVLAMFVALCLRPAVQMQVRRYRLPRIVAIVTTFVAGAAVVALLSLVVTMSVVQLRDNLASYQQSVGRSMDWVQAHLPLERLGYEPAELEDNVLNRMQGYVGEALQEVFRQVMTLLSQGSLVLLIVLFLLLGPDPEQAPTGGLRGEVELRVKRFLVITVFISGLTGVLVGGTLWLLGVELALAFGLLAFLLNFIPNIGSVIATLLPLPVVLLNPELGLAAKSAAMVVPAIIQFVLGNFVAPRLLGSSLDLHPVTVILALILFGYIWGIVGMFLATPLVATLKIACEHHPFTRPIAQLMSGRSPERSAPPPPPSPPPVVAPPAA